MQSVSLLLTLHKQTLSSGLLIDVELTHIRAMELKTICSLLLMIVSIFNISELLVNLIISLLYHVYLITS